MWGRMDAATEMVNLLLRPEYLETGTAEERAKRIGDIVTAPFGDGPAAPDTDVRAAEMVCAALWARHAAGVEQEMSKAEVSSRPETLDLTKRVVLTRWHLQLLVEELPIVNSQPLEPGDSAASKVPSDALQSGGGPAEAARLRLEGLMRRYEQNPRRVGDIWGRRKTTALGVRFARQAADGLAPGPGRGAMFKRIAIAVPLFVAVAAWLSRGAFLIAWNALVGLVLLPRLRPTARLTIGAVSFVLSVIFWLNFVRRKPPRSRKPGIAFRQWGSGLLFVGFLAAGIVGTWQHGWIVRPPDHFRAAWPWSGLSHRGGVFWPSVVVAGATILAVVCLWIWAKPWAILVGAAVAGAFMGAWDVLGAWRHSADPSSLQRTVAAFGSMWFPAIGLALAFTWAAVGGHPEDRPGPPEGSG